MKTKLTLAGEEFGSGNNKSASELKGQQKERGKYNYSCLAQKPYTQQRRKKRESQNMAKMVAKCGYPLKRQKQY